MSSKTIEITCCVCCGPDHEGKLEHRFFPTYELWRMPDGWINLGEQTIAVTVPEYDEHELITKAIETLNERIAQEEERYMERVRTLRTQIRQLQLLTFQPEE